MKMETLHHELLLAEEDDIPPPVPTLSSMYSLLLLPSGFSSTTIISNEVILLTLNTEDLIPSDWRVHGSKFNLGFLFFMRHILIVQYCRMCFPLPIPQETHQYLCG